MRKESLYLYGHRSEIFTRTTFIFDTMIVFSENEYCCVIHAKLMYTLEINKYGFERISSNTPTMGHK